jgi:2-dehydro-3-deoxygluconokinase
MDKVFCFGEILLHFSPKVNSDFIANQNMPFCLGGAELNVATALANWEVPVAYGTAMPDNFLSKAIITNLSTKKIDTSSINFSGNKMGVFYLAQGMDMKNAAVVFDRADSSFANLQKGMIDWEKQLQGIGWFHITAISASLTTSATEVCLEALKAASAMGITISIDLNYRPKLWQYGKTPLEVMPELVQYANVIMGNLWAVEKMLGVKSTIKESAGSTADQLNNAAKESMKKLSVLYPKAHHIAYTFRLEHEYHGVLQQEDQFFMSQLHALDNIINIVGSGDCFMAGLIFAIQQNKSPQDKINFAAAAGVGKLYELGDATHQTIEQIKKRMS